MRLAPFVGGRAGVEDPEITVDCLQRDMRVTEDDEVGLGKPAAKSRSRPSFAPASWIMPTRRPARSSSAVSLAPHALTSGPSLLPTTACTGAYADSSSSTLATQTSPACKITSAVRRCSATAGGQRFQNRGACVSERTTMRIDSSFQAHPGRLPWAWWAS